MVQKGRHLRQIKRENWGIHGSLLHERVKDWEEVVLRQRLVRKAKEPAHARHVLLCRDFREWLVVGRVTAHRHDVVRHEPLHVAPISVLDADRLPIRAVRGRGRVVVARGRHADGVRALRTENPKVGGASVKLDLEGLRWGSDRYWPDVLHLWG